MLITATTLHIPHALLVQLPLKLQNSNARRHDLNDRLLTMIRYLRLELKLASPCHRTISPLQPDTDIPVLILAREVSHAEKAVCLPSELSTLEGGAFEIVRFLRR